MPSTLESSSEVSPSRIRVIITAESPLLFSERKPGGLFQQSLPYIPGGALRGALATLLLEGKPHSLPHKQEEPCVFCERFLGPEAAIFTNAYPACDIGEDVCTLPATAMSCKNNSGFLSPQLAVEKTPHQAASWRGHGVFDTLIERLCWETLQPSALVYSPTCPVCGGRVEAYQGWYVCHDHDSFALHFHRRDVDQRLLTRVAINRRRMVAESGMLYSPYVISEVVELDRHEGQDGHRYAPTRFVGTVWRWPTEDKATLERVAALGGSNSRGLGHVSVQAVLTQEDDTPGQQVRARIEALDADIDQVWKLFRRLGSREESKSGIYFTLGLWSDAILYTPQGLPTMVFDADMLEINTGIRAELVRSYASYGHSGGWQGAWGLPKPAQVLTNRGAVYVFRAEKLSDEDCQALAMLEVQGIGVRTTEGYGQVRVSDSFHLQRRKPNEHPRA